MHTLGEAMPQFRHAARRGGVLIVLVLCALTALMATAHSAHAGRFDVPAMGRKAWSPHKKMFLSPLPGRALGNVGATWYGPGFYGNRTGCGRTLRTTTFGVAHRTLPCGTMVRLRFNGREIAVPVIDRGPYSGATFDLTERTAVVLRFKAYGYAHVNAVIMDRHRIAIRRL